MIQTSYIVTVVAGSNQYPLKAFLDEGLAEEFKKQQNHFVQGTHRLVIEKVPIEISSGWKRGAPTTPGWYWLKSARLDIVKVFELEGELRFYLAGDDEDYDVKLWDDNEWMAVVQPG